MVSVRKAVQDREEVQNTAQRALRGVLTKLKSSRATRVLKDVMSLLVRFSTSFCFLPRAVGEQKQGGNGIPRDARREHARTPDP